MDRIIWPLILIAFVTIALRLQLAFLLRRVAGQISHLATLIPSDQDSDAAKELLAARCWHRKAWMKSRKQPWNVFRTYAALRHLDTAEEKANKAQHLFSLSQEATWRYRAPERAPYPGGALRSIHPRAEDL